MGAIRVPRGLQQPQIFAGFNPALPRPSFAYVASLGLYERARQRRGTQAAGDAVRITQHGAAYKVANATNGGLDFGTVQPITSDAFTIIVLANGASTDGLATLMSQRTSATPYNQVNLYLNADNASAGSAGRFALFTYGDYSSATHSDSTSLVDGQFHVWGATKSGANNAPILWYDGVQPAQTGTITGAVSTVIAPTQKLRLGNIGDYTADAAYCSSSDIAAVLCFNGVLSDAQMRALTDSLLAPYRIFQPATRRWIPTAAVPVVNRGAKRSFVAHGAPSPLYVNAAGLRQYALLGVYVTDAYVAPITATVGDAVAAGLVASIAVNIAIAASAGNAAADGLTADIAADVVVSADTGSAIGAGLLATVAGSITIVATVGDSVASGQTADVAENISIAASGGDVAAAGSTADIATDVSVSALVGTADAAGLTAVVGSQVTIAAAVGEAQASGVVADVVSAITVTASIGSATAAGQSAAIANDRTVAAIIGDAVATGRAAAVSNAGNIGCITANAIASGAVAYISADVAISAGIGDVAADGRTAASYIRFTIPADIGDAVANGLLAELRTPLGFMVSDRFWMLGARKRWATMAPRQRVERVRRN